MATCCVSYEYSGEGKKGFAVFVQSTLGETVRAALLAKYVAHLSSFAVWHRTPIQRLLKMKRAQRGRI